MSLQRSPLAPEGFPDLPQIAGLRMSTAAAAVRYEGRTDVLLAHMAAGTTLAGVYTRSATRSAAVLDCQAKTGGDSTGTAALLINSGNSNAFTGQHGTASVARLTQAVAQVTGAQAGRVFTSSTGVIGEPLPDERITSKLGALHAELGSADFEAAARAIMTTDTFPKGAGARLDIGGREVRIAGIAKGSGMIAPDMATMLVYIFTDAQVDQARLQSLTAQSCARTFNCITVDSDTSTSDTLIVAATGATGVDASAEPRFAEALEAVMRDLAQQVVRDGEGATKFVEITVTGAASDGEARCHALSIANSPLVKTAIAGEDPNWGRIVMAVGKSGAAADRDRLKICFGDITVAENGWVSPQYAEEAGARYMTRTELQISVDVGVGKGSATVWTCDLTHGYITINADYRS